jgi:hypothetical protein
LEFRQNLVGCLCRGDIGHLVWRSLEENEQEYIMIIFLTLLLSLFAAGGGQAYLGDMKKAYVYGGVYISTPLIAPVILRISMGSSGDTGLRIAFVYVACMSAVMVISIIDAVFTAIRLRNSNSLNIRLERGLIFTAVVWVIQIGLKLSGLPLLLLKK